MSEAKGSFRFVRRIPAAQFLTYSLAAKAVGLLAGLLVIRTLPPSEYGGFVLVTSLAGLINILSDAGIAPALTANAARANVTDGSSQVPLIARGVLGVRVKRLLYAVPAAVVITAYQGGSTSDLAHGVVVTVGLATFLGLSSITVATASSCVSAIGRAELVAASDLRAATLRCLFIGLAWSLDCLSGVLAVILMVCANLSIIARLNQVCRDPLRSGDARVNSEVETRFIADIRRDAQALIPNYVYFSMTGALPAILLSSTASAGGLAEYGAYGRIGVLFGALAPMLSLKFIPHVARIGSRNLVPTANKVLVLILLGSLASCFIVTRIDFGELILGSQYGGLPATLMSATLYYWFRFGADTLFSMMVGARGQARHVLVVATASIVLIVSLAFGFVERDAAGVYSALSCACLVEMVGCRILVGTTARQGV